MVCARGSPKCLDFTRNTPQLDQLCPRWGSNLWTSAWPTDALTSWTNVTPYWIFSILKIFIWLQKCQTKEQNWKWDFIKVLYSNILLCFSITCDSLISRFSCFPAFLHIVDTWSLKLSSLSRYTPKSFTHGSDFMILPSIFIMSPLTASFFDRLHPSTIILCTNYNYNCFTSVKPCSLSHTMGFCYAPIPRCRSSTSSSITRAIGFKNDLELICSRWRTVWILQ